MWPNAYAAIVHLITPAWAVRAKSYTAPWVKPRANSSTRVAYAGIARLSRKTSWRVAFIAATARPKKTQGILHTQSGLGDYGDFLFTKLIIV